MPQKSSSCPEATPPPERPLKERRAWVRYPINRDASYRLFGQGLAALCLARVNDLSAAGIGLLADTCFPPGAILEVKLEGIASNLSRTLLARVKQTQEQANGQWLVGCVLVTRLKEGELQALV